MVLPHDLMVLPVTVMHDCLTDDKIMFALFLVT